VGVPSGNEVEQGPVPSQQASEPVVSPAPTAAAPLRIEFVDGVRALAALYVVAHHTLLTVYGVPPTGAPSIFAPLLYGHFGVAVFIVVSGFSLGLAPARRGWHLGRGGYWTFMRRRAWRILPPYWAALALSVVLVILLTSRTNDPLSWKGVGTHFFLVQDFVSGKTPNGAFWSIAVEWQLYWIFPLLLLIRRRPGPVALIAVAVAFVATLGVVAEHGGGGVVAHKLLHASPQLGALFVFGIVAASVVSSPGAPHRRWWGPVALIAGVAVVLACVLLGTKSAANNSFWLFYWLDLIIGVAVASGVAYLTATETSRVRRVLQSRALVSVGHFSYSLYLVHAPLLALAWFFIVKPLGLSSLAAFAVMFGIVAPLIVVASYFFHRVAERPFMESRSWADLRAYVASRKQAAREPVPIR
jgi:peptidoglycan/LPS O-acetylase OafA/YrhL